MPRTNHGPAAAKTVKESPHASPFTNPSGDSLKVQEGFAEWSVESELPDVTPDRAQMKLDKSESPREDGNEPAPESKNAVNPEGDRPPLGVPGQPEGAKEATAKPGTPAPSQDGEAAPGSESAEAVPEDLAGIFKKYGTKEQIGHAYKEIQKLSTAQGEENKSLKAELESANAERALVDRYFETADDGTRKLRPERAAERLQEVVLPSQMKSPAALLKEAQEEYSGLLREAGIEDDDIGAALENAKGRIAEIAKRKGEALDRQVREQKVTEGARAGRIADEHFRKHPDHEAAIPLLNEFLSGFPEDVRHRMLNAGWAPFGKLSEIFYKAAVFEDAITEAWNSGTKNGANRLTPQDGGSPASGSTTPRSPGITKDADADVKYGIVNARVLASLFD